MTRSINTLIWLLLGILAVRLGLTAILPLADTTEPRYAEIARIMAESGDWITPWFDYGVPFWGKPPLSFWSQAVSFRIFGVSEFAARLPSWLANGGVVYLIYTLGRYLHADHNSVSARTNGLWAALIYATTSLGFVSAGTVMTDSFLVLGTTLTLSSLVIRLQGGSRAWGWLFFVGLAVGLLAKGPLVIVLTGLPVFLWVMATRQWNLLYRAVPWVRGSALMLALATPWYVLAELKTPGFIDYFIIGEHFKRFLVSSWQGDLYGNAHEFPRGTIWWYLVLASFPWGIIALAALGKQLLRRSGSLPESAWQTDYKGIPGLILASALSPALFFTLSGNILWTYVLPGLPFLAIWIARLLPANAGSRLSGFRRASIALTPVIAILASGWLAFHPSLIKSEQQVVQRIEQMPGVSAKNLVYVDKAPFSARFYSEGQVQSVSTDEIDRQMRDASFTGPMYIAVGKGDKRTLKLVEDRATRFDQDRRFIIFRLEPDENTADRGRSPTGQNHAGDAAGWSEHRGLAG
ncbi:glycosyltransferase family 39 protein [Marinobacter salinexigens]|uniref:Glycosyltransferase family 39 protein n=1 Tax=Marinobacter salinexigens TaxID=2919747 RepID=A0A5B0VKC9_9GAMM|nr:glycosyltransferase family 39 protein [Marinobacter salinexigens]KAA1174379.1 glycosyltransferase family 39 protein [Marinobacter salinexigens]